MKATHLTRILSLVLALVLVLGASPVVRAETLETVTDEAVSIMGAMEAGGNAPTLNSSLSDFATHQENEDRTVNNNTMANAYGVDMTMSVLGATRSEDKNDYYKFTLTSTAHVSLASICNSDNMAFTLHDNKGNTLEVCTYYGTADGWNVDAIRVMLPAGTYYVRIYQIASSTTAAYARQVDYVIEFHTHTITGSATGNALTKTHSFNCTSCGTVNDEQCYIVNGRCTYCGTVPTSLVYRAAGADRIATSLAIAKALKSELGVSRFSNIVVASALNFPDALTGSYLAAVKDAPILLTYDKVHSQIISYIRSNLASGGTVYILGGTGAVSASFENQLYSAGIRYKRLAGNDRLGTNLAILNEAGVSYGSNVLVCTATGYADSLSASATGLPILLVGSSLTAEQRSFLSNVGGSITIIGGTSAVSSSLESQLRSYGSVSRLAGSNRYETSVKVAQRFFSNPYTAVLAYAKNYPDGLCGGPLAYTMGAPLILTDSNYHPARNYTLTTSIMGGYVLGSGELISNEAARWIFSMNRTEPLPSV